MARPLRIEFEGALYHVIARGNARSDIFFDDEKTNRTGIVKKEIATPTAMQAAHESVLSIR